MIKQMLQSAQFIREMVTMSDYGTPKVLGCGLDIPVVFIHALFQQIDFEGPYKTFGPHNIGKIYTCTCI